MGLEFTLSGFIVGLLVGLTGVGGGSLMTPLLVLLFKINPAIAIGTDLLYASITKSAGVISHSKLGHIQWNVVQKLMLGSIPASILTTFFLKQMNLGSPDTMNIIEMCLGIALIFTAIAVLTQPIIIERSKNKVIKNNPNTGHLTILLGLFLGIMVTVTSVGAGALGVTVLLILYPKMSVKNIIGTDIAHAVPITFIAGLGHYNLGHVDFILLGTLLLGSIPGIWVGSFLSSKIDENKLRYVLVLVLILIGIKLIINF
jgi:uncharacterized membrane protein YfcA